MLIMKFDTIEFSVFIQTLLGTTLYVDLLEFLCTKHPPLALHVITATHLQNNDNFALRLPEHLYC
jgi:hypothetical protein